MKVAFTTSDMVHINAHFGSAKTLAVYDVNTEGYNLVENIEFSGELKQDGNEDKLLPKIEALADCTIVYVAAIGGSAAARLIRKKVTPVKARSEEDEIASVLEQLVTTLKGSPPPWLRKVLQQEEAKKNGSSDFEDEEEE